MKKRDFFTIIGVLADDEDVFFRLPDGSIVTVEDVKIEDDENPISAVISLKEAEKRRNALVAERKKNREKREKEERALAKQQEKIAADAKAEADQAFQAAVDAAVASALKSKR